MAGVTETTTYSSWENMNQRCNNPRCKDYPVYGGAGVVICPRWMSYKLFLEDMGVKPFGTSLDRIDGSKGYEPTNCKWSTPLEQAANRRTTKPITYLGRTQSRSAWAREYGISPSAVIMRTNAGWSLEKALTTPIRSKV